MDYIVPGPMSIGSKPAAIWDLPFGSECGIVQESLLVLLANSAYDVSGEG